MGRYAYDFFSLRIPVFPLEKISEYTAAEQQGQGEAFLLDLLNDRLFCEGLLLASPVFYREILRFHDLQLAEKKRNKLLKTLYRYFIRCCTRPLPFGHFAGYAEGTIGDSASEFVLDQDRVRSVPRLAEMPVKVLLGYIAGHILPDNRLVDPAPDLSIFNYYPLPGGHQKTDRKQQLVSQLFSVFLLADHPFDRLLEIVAPYANEELCKVITQIRDTLSAGASVLQLQESLLTIFRRLDPDREWELMLEADLFVGKDNRLNIGEGVVEALLKATDELNAIAPDTTHFNLSLFAEAFTRRYGEAEVSFAEVLDQQNGLLFPPSPAESCTYNGEKLVPRQVEDQWSRQLQELILAKYSLAVKENHQEVRFTETEIHRLSRRQHGCQQSFYLQGHFIAADAANLDKGDFSFFLKRQSAPSALALIAKTAFGLSFSRQKMEAFIVQEEERMKEVIQAEIIFAPEGAYDNSLYRPILRKHAVHVEENLYDTNPDHVTAADLMISVKEGEIVLFSKTLQKRVIPILTCGHNFYKESSAYRLLCELQYQRRAPLFSWDWGMLSGMEFLPRVTYKNLILSKASWLISYQELQVAIERYDHPVEVVRQLQKKHQFPVLFTINTGDQELLIDSSSKFSCNVFLSSVMASGIRITEVPDTGGLVKGQNHRIYQHEVIIPVCPAISQQKLTGGRPVAEVLRYLPQQEWMYYKIYGRPLKLQHVLTEELYPLLQKMKEEGMISAWFYIRFDDPHYHLRLRLKLCHPDSSGCDAAVSSNINKALQSFIAKAELWNVQLDTYVPEVSRYGLKTIGHCEQLFHYDSICMMNLFTAVSASDSGWLMALLNIEILMNDFQLNSYERIELIYALETQFLKQLKITKAQQLGFDAAYRENKKQITDLLDPKSDGQPSCLDRKEGAEELYRPILIDGTVGLEKAGLLEIFAQRSALIREQLPLMDAQKSHYPDHAVAPGKMIDSMIHMSMNRMFLTQQNRNELFVYSMLRRYYESRIYRLKYGVKP